MSLVLENPLQPILEIPPDLTLWEQAVSDVDTAAQWRLYLHLLGAPAILRWCQDAFLADSPFGRPSGKNPLAQLWPEPNPLNIWHVVDGLAITLDKKRIVVMLSEAMDTAEMRVPQEWIDLPDWMGDYYISAYVDVDEQQLALWGYATYAQVKQQGQYDASDRTYCLTEDYLIEDFSAFWAAQQLEVLDTVALDILPEILPVQLDNLVSRLAGSLDPRLEIPFSLWGALLSDPAARSQLYQQRQGKTTIQTAVANTPTQLGQWTTQLFSQGWKSIETLLPKMPALHIRSTAQTVITGNKAVVLHTRAQTFDLVLAITVTLEEELGERRNIRIRLYPAGEPLVADLADRSSLAGNFSEDRSFAAAGPSAAAGVPSTELPSVLPSGVSMTLLFSDTGETLQTVQARDLDSYIQLPPFRCPIGQRFSVCIRQTDGSVQEDFVS